MKKVNEILEWLNLHCGDRLVISRVDATNKFNIRDAKTGGLFASPHIIPSHVINPSLKVKYFLCSCGIVHCLFGS